MSARESSNSFGAAKVTTRSMPLESEASGHRSDDPNSNYTLQSGRDPRHRRIRRIEGTAPSGLLRSFPPRIDAVGGDDSVLVIDPAAAPASGRAQRV
jgi:hypothetical protein